MRKLALGLTASMTFAIGSAALAADMKEPGGSPEAAQIATFNPDEFAWQLFFYISQQAAADKAGVPDAGKPSFREYDPDRGVVWETWALASGEDNSEVFKSPAVKPDEWDRLRRPAADKLLSKSVTGNPLAELPGFNVDVFRHVQRQRDVAPLFFPNPGQAGEEEVRMNRATFDMVRDKELYSREGLARRYAQVPAPTATSGTPLLVTFPQGAKEVKAQWVRIGDTDADKRRYHWRSVRTTAANGVATTETWGLMSMHVITRDLPNWFWADFGHLDGEKQAWCGTPRDVEGETCPKDSTTRAANAPSGTNGVRTETKSTKWENYILRGTQTGYVDSIGRKTKLSNPIIENGFQKSSCMSCHARSAVRPDGRGGVTTLGSQTTALGAPDPSAYITPAGTYLQVDFLFSISFRARSEKPQPAGAPSMSLMR